MIPDEDWLWLRQKAELKLGISKTESPPFSFKVNDGTYEGISADAASLISKLLGVQVEVVAFSTSQQAIQALQSGTIDVFDSHGYDVVGADVKLSTAYVQDHLAAFVRNTEYRYLPDDFSQLTIAIPAEYRMELESRFPHAHFSIFPNSDQALAAVAFGQADIYVDDVYSAYYRINNLFYGVLRFERIISGSPPVDHRYAVRADNARLASSIDAALAAVGRENLNALTKRWVGNTTLPGEGVLDLTSEQIRWIDRHPVVRLIVNDDLAPGAYFDENGVFSGAIVDLLDLVTLKTGLRFHAVSRSGGLPNIKEALEKGEADLAIMTESTLREEYLRFSRPMPAGPFVLLSKLEDKGTLQNLDGKRIAIPAGHVGLEEMRKQFPLAQLIEVGGALDSMNLLYNGNADAAVASLPSARYYNERFFQGRLAINYMLNIAPPTTSFAMRRGDVELQGILDKVLKSIPPDELTAIVGRWRSPPGMSGQTWVDYQKVIVKVVAIASFILLVALVFILLQRRNFIARMQKKEDIKKQLYFLQALIESIPLPLYVRSEQGRILSCNHSYLSSLGLQAEQVLNKSIKDLPAACFEHNLELDQKFHHAIQSGKMIEANHSVQLMNHERKIRYWIQPLQDSTKDLRVGICGWVDITEHHRIVEQLQVAKETADLASVAKTTFLATMSHEIRTPMNAIIGMLELALKRDPQTPIDRSSIEIAYTSARGLLDLIGDILDIARIESGRLSLSPKRANLRELVESVAQVFDGVARQKRLNLTLEIDASINCDVLVDAMRFKQILANLLSNAIKFTEAGTVSVNIAGTFKKDSVLHVNLRVKDTGVGISAVDQKRLFIPFSQVRRNINQIEGSGLGLVICRSLCEMMGGYITMHSEIGRGTQIEVDLHLQSLDKLEVVPLHFSQPPQQRYCLQVLIVDDHAVNRKVLHEQLVFLGHEVIEAQNGEVAFNYWIQNPVDIIITDCHMPIMGGAELSRSVRAVEQEQGLDRTVILGLTADAQPEEIELCIQAGMMDCLVKPLSLDELDRRLRELHCDDVVESRTRTVDEQSSKISTSDLIDISHLESLINNAPMKVQNILRELINSNQRDRELMSSLLAKDNIEGLSELAHRIKGAARMVRGSVLIEACEKLEAACHVRENRVGRMKAVEDIYSAIGILEQELVKQVGYQEEKLR